MDLVRICLGLELLEALEASGAVRKHVAVEGKVWIKGPWRIVRNRSSRPCGDRLCCLGVALQGAVRADLDEETVPMSVWFTALLLFFGVLCALPVVVKPS